MKLSCVNPCLSLTAKLSVLVMGCLYEPSGYAGDESFARIAAFSGEVQIVRASERVKAAKGSSLAESDVVQTGPGGIVQVKFSDGSSFTLYEKSSMRIDFYKKNSPSSGGVAESAYRIMRGKLRFFVNPNAKEKQRTEFRSKTAVMGIRGTSGIIDVKPSGVTQLVVLTGLVEVQNPKFPSMVVAVPPNFSTQVAPERAPQPPKAVDAVEIQKMVPVAPAESGFSDDGSTGSPPPKSPTSTEPKDQENNSKPNRKDSTQSDEMKGRQGQTDEKQEKSQPEGRGKKAVGSVKTLFAPGGGAIEQKSDPEFKAGVSRDERGSSSSKQTQDSGTAEVSPPSSVGAAPVTASPQVPRAVTTDIQRQVEKVSATISTTTETSKEIVRGSILPSVQPTPTPPPPVQKVKINIGLPKD